MQNMQWCAFYFLVLGEQDEESYWYCLHLFPMLTKYIILSGNQQATRNTTDSACTFSSDQRFKNKYEIASLCFKTPCPTTEHTREPLNHFFFFNMKQKVRNLQEYKILQFSKWSRYLSSNIILVQVQTYQVFQVTQLRGNCTLNIVFVEFSAR